MNEIIVEGKTVEEAIEQGLSQLGLAREQVDIEVVDEGKQGLFGIMGKTAQVRIRPLQVPVDRALRIVREILERMAIEAEVEGSRVEGELMLEISGAGGVLIGRKGQTLSALQYLVNRIYNKGQENLERISVDIEGYRKRREKEMTELADRLYRKALDQDKSISVKNLSAHDRRIIHMKLKDRNDVETHSHGVGHLRRIVISPRNRNRRRKGSGASERVRTFTKRFESPPRESDDS